MRYPFYPCPEGEDKSTRYDYLFHKNTRPRGRWRETGLVTILVLINHSLQFLSRIEFNSLEIFFPGLAGNRDANGCDRTKPNKNPTLSSSYHSTGGALRLV